MLIFHFSWNPQFYDRSHNSINSKLTLSYLASLRSILILSSHVPLGLLLRLSDTNAVIISQLSLACYMPPQIPFNFIALIISEYTNLHLTQLGFNFWPLWLQHKCQILQVSCLLFNVIFNSWSPINILLHETEGVSS